MPARFALLLSLVLFVAAGMAPPAQAAEASGAADEGVVEEVLAILHERGLVDDGEYNRLSSRQQTWREEQERGPLIEWSGDMRARFESFWFDEDPVGNEDFDRSRIRYRLRLKGQVRINPYVKAVFRFASGGVNRSANRTLGQGTDFDPDGLFIDQAYLEFTPPEGWIPGASRLRFGKMDVPFRWKHSPDSNLWDRDLQVEGVALLWDGPEFGRYQPYVRVAYLIADENALSRDPHVFGIQAGVDADLGPDWRAGGRVTHYEWRSLDPDFLDRSALFGNVRDGLNGTANGGTGLSITELAGYVGWDGIEGWPLVVYGHVLRNHDATSSSLTGADDEGMGYAVGLTFGDKRHIAKLAAGWYRMEANSWPGRFIDSPLLGGFANREAWAFSATREVLLNTDFKISLFIGDHAEDGDEYANSLLLSERVLLQTDIQVRF